MGKPISEKSFNDCSLAELKREATRQMGMKQLKCPECGEPVLSHVIDDQKNIEVVVFKCLFSATFDRGISPEDAQKKLAEFKSSGKMREGFSGGL